MDLKYILKAALVVGLLTAHVTPSYSQSISKYAGEFISGGVGARSLGMGGAFVGVANDVTSGYWNAAGLVGVKHPQAAVMHSERFAGIVKYDYAAYAAPYGENRVIGLSLIRLGVEGIPNTTNALLDYGSDGIPGTDDPDGTEGNGQLDDGERLDEREISRFGDSEWAVYLSYGRRLNERLSYGGSVKFIRKAFDSHSAHGLGFDLGARYRIAEGLYAGGNLQDATTTLLAWDTGTKELISPTLRAGVSYELNLPLTDAWALPSVEVITHTDGERPFDDGFKAGPLYMNVTFGAEIHLNERLRVRFGKGEIEPFSAGLGVSVRGLTADYSYGSSSGADDLGDIHRISLTVDITRGIWQGGG